MTSEKNQLQEFFQKRKEPLPKYKTVQDDDSPPHAPVWISVITLPDGRTYIGDTAFKKSTAENSAAKMALKNLNNYSSNNLILQGDELTTPKEIVNRCWESELICIIDMENIPQAVYLDPTIIPDNTFLLGIVGHCHSVSRKVFPFPKYIVKSAMKDSVDHAISYIAGFIAGTLVDHTLDVCFRVSMPRFLILSRDHYAESTVLFLKQQKFIATHVTTVRDLINSFKI